MRPLTISLLAVAITLFTGGTASARTYYAPTCFQPTNTCIPVDEDDLPAMEVSHVGVCEDIPCRIK